ncbi:hypothetical protein V1514DRAFT_281704 [Lipomyces japonicus]|uniref:uncharacterized protein n=1 Tax=Lipomyces japonicus TaxID=56871 RepID=UPI0034CD7A72
MKKVLTEAKRTYSVKENANKILFQNGLDELLPEWGKNHKRVTRSSTGNSKSLLNNLQEVIVDDDYVIETRSRKPTRKLGGTLRYKFGENRAVVVTEEDFSRLEQGEFLNDTVIDFYLKYIEHKLEQTHADIAKSTYFFNTFFYKSLTKKVNGKSSYDNVKKWTSKVDIFSKRFVVIPIHERAHWYVAVICNVSKLGEPVIETSLSADQLQEVVGIERIQDSEADDTPIIFVFDSLKLRHNSIFKPLREYLVAEAQEKRGLTLSVEQIKARYGVAPIQPNYCDCGVFVLHYVEQFLSRPDAFLPLLVDVTNEKRLVEQQLHKLWDVEKLGLKRQRMQDIMVELFNEVGSESEGQVSGDGAEDEVDDGHGDKDEKDETRENSESSKTVESIEDIESIENNYTIDNNEIIETIKHNHNDNDNQGDDKEIRNGDED